MKSIQREFIPGSKWVYIKIYTGNKNGEEFFILKIIPIIIYLEKNNYIQKYFFIRYNDPDFHFRIRLFVNKIENISYIISSFHLKVLPYIKSKQIWKIQLDTYMREIERYSSLLIEDSESIFYIDSKYITKLISTIYRLKDESLRWKISLLLLDSYLNLFKLTIEQKIKVMSFLSSSFKTEFGFNKYNSKQLNLKYREEKNNIELILYANKEINPSINSIIKNREKEMMHIVDIILRKINCKRCNIEKYELLSHYIHMTFNRLFISNNRIYEMLIYEYMYRHYTSEVAKNKVLK